MTEEEPSSIKSLSDVFYEMFPYYLSIGMTEEQFWYGEPYLVQSFRKAREYQIEARNQELWLQGLYVYDAFAVVLGNAFRGKSGKVEKYIDKPFNLFDRKVKDAEKRARDERDKLIQALSLWKENFDSAKGR